MKPLILFVVLTCLACHADEKTQEEIERIVSTTDNDDIRVFFLPLSWLVPSETNRLPSSSWIVPPLTNRTYSVKDFKLLKQGEKTELALPAAADGTRETYLFENGRVTGVRLHGGGTDETLIFNESAIFKLVPEPVRSSFRLQAATNSIANDLFDFTTGADTDKSLFVNVTKRHGFDAIVVAFPNGVHWRFSFDVRSVKGGVIMERFDRPPKETGFVFTSVFCLCCEVYNILSPSGDHVYQRQQIESMRSGQFYISFRYSRKDDWGVLVTDYEADTLKAFDFSGNLIKSRKLDLENPMLNSRGDPFKD